MAAISSSQLAPRRLHLATVFWLTPWRLDSALAHDVERADAVARQLCSGTVGYSVFRTDFSIGFGSFNQSSLGR